jgi:hypothetical protein
MPMKKSAAIQNAFAANTWKGEASSSRDIGLSPDIVLSSDTELLRPSEAARLMGVRPKTLANWRCQGIGPAFVKFGPPSSRAAVRYNRGDLLKWIAARTREPKNSQ